MNSLSRLNFLRKQQLVIIKNSDDLIEKVIQMLDYQDYDYSKNLIVFPGKRPSYYLKKALAQRVGSSFISPLIFSIEEFVEFLFKKFFNYSSIEPIDAVGFIYKICLKHDLLTPFFRKFDNFISFGFKFFNLFEELCIEEVSVNQLKEVETLINIPVKSQEKLRFLSIVYEEFYKELLDKKLFTRSLKYRKVAEIEDLEKYLDFKNLIYAGFFALTSSEEKILRKLAKMENFYFIFQEEVKFDQTLFNKITLYSCPDTHAEVKIAGNIIKESGFDENTVIVLPKSDTLFPLLRHGISFLKEEDYNISIGYPLSRTPIYGFFNSLFEVVNSIENNQIYIPAYLNFVLHPYTKNVLLKSSAELSRIVFHEIENLFKSEDNPPFVEIEWLEEEVPKIISQRLLEFNLTVDEIREHIKLIHENTIKKFIKIKNIEEFINHCKDVLLFVYEKTTARFHYLFYPYVESFLSQFSKISHSTIKELHFEHIESYFNFFRNIIMFEKIPFHGTPLRGLQILGFLETRNIKFKRVIFLDLNEGVFPDLSEDYLMPYRLRKILGLHTYQEREKLVYYYFSLLINNAEEVHLCYIKNDKNERSRFIEKIIWEVEKISFKKADIPVSSLSWSVNLVSKKPLEIQKTENTMEVINNLCLSPSAVDMYLECGLKFYYFYILKLIKKRDISVDIDYSDIGTIVHESIKEYFKLRKGKRLNPGDFSDDIKLIVNEIFLKKYGNKITGNLYLLRLQIIKRLVELVEYYKKISNKHQLKIIEVEELIEEELFNTKFKYRIDLVERIDNSLIIVDYKTSGSEDNYKIKFDKLDISDRQSWSKYIGSLQIPIYILLYSKKYEINPVSLNGHYFLLGKASINDEKVRFDPFNSINKEEGLEIVKTILRTLLNEIKDKNIPFFPTSDFKSSCKFCDFQSICGTLITPSKIS